MARRPSPIYIHGVLIIDPAYFAGRGATVYFRPKPEIQGKTAEPTPQTSDPASDQKDTEEKSGPLHDVAEALKAALPSSLAPKAKAKADSTSSSDAAAPASASKGRDIVLGSLGILHPSVLANFELTRPCSSLEIDVEPLL